MPRKYRFNSEDKTVISEVKGLMRRLIYSGKLQPAQMVSVAKILHVLSNLPAVNDYVSVTVELTGNGKDHGRFRSLCLSVSEKLHLECATHIDWFPSMEWHAYPGRRTEHDEHWETEWLPHFYSSNDPLALNLDDCDITVEDEDNPLLSLPDQDAPEASDESLSGDDLGASSAHET